MKKQVVLTPEEEACLQKNPAAWRNWLILAIAIAVYAVFTQLSIPGLEANGAKALGYVVAVILLLLFEVFPIAVVSILAVLLAGPLGLVPEAEAFANFAVGPGFFVFGSFNDRYCFYLYGVRETHVAVCQRSFGREA